MIDVSDKEKIKRKLRSDPDLNFRSITKSDLEKLRLWKNEHRNSFFSKGLVSAQQQLLWYEGFLSRPLDFMMILEVSRQPVGCIGIRWLNDHWDIYNVIMGEREYSGLGFMSITFKEILLFADSKQKGPFKLKVLRKNPAVKWYKRQGFVVTEEQESFYVMLCECIQ